MRFVIVGDLHGQKPEIYYQSYDAIIAPGDFCGNTEKIRGYMFKILESKKKGENLDKQWYDLVGKKTARKWVKESLELGREVLEYLDSLGVPVYVIPGNWDWVHDNSIWKFLDKDYYHDYLLKDLKNVVDCHNKFVPISDELCIVGYGLNSAPELPQHAEDMAMLTPKEFEKLEKVYEDKKEILVQCFRQRKSGKHKRQAIFLTHNVPFNTAVDKITWKESPRYGQHYGSILVKEMVEVYRPPICIGGHIHENFSACKMGKTTVINAGYGSKVNVWLELDDKKKKVEFYKGD